MTNSYFVWQRLPSLRHQDWHLVHALVQRHPTPGDRPRWLFSEWRPATACKLVLESMWVSEDWIVPVYRQWLSSASEREACEWFVALDNTPLARNPCSRTFSPALCRIATVDKRNRSDRWLCTLQVHRRRRSSNHLIFVEMESFNLNN